MSMKELFQKELNEASSSDEDFNNGEDLSLDEGDSSESEDFVSIGSDTDPEPDNGTPAEMEAPAGAGRPDDQSIVPRKRPLEEPDGDSDSDSDSDAVASSSDGEAAGQSTMLTRSQRRKIELEEEQLSKQLPPVKPSDEVVAIWDRIRTAPANPHRTTTTSATGETGVPSKNDDSKYEEEYITIKRTYKFAGETKTEEKRVAKSSAEAKAFLSSQAAAKNKTRRQHSDESPSENSKEPEWEEQTDNQSNTPPKVRPLRRPSRFDPNPIGIVRTLPPDLQLRWPREPTFVELLERYQPHLTTGPRRGRGGGLTVLSTRAGASALSRRSRASAQPGASDVVPIAANLRSLRQSQDTPAMKLNTIDKSRFDWAGYVDQAGLADELDKYGKAKESYLGRTNFLANAEAKQEEARRTIIRQKHKQEGGSVG